MTCAVAENNGHAVKLNIGAGDTKLDGWTPVDRKFGQEAFPLPAADNSVEAIRASHILEHFSYADVPKALAEWFRVLKPGGEIKIAVPDAAKIVCGLGNQAEWRFHLFGGQRNGDDFHKSGFDEELLRFYLQQAGFENVQTWTDDVGDCSSLPISLNLKGIKPLHGKASTGEIKITAIMSVPRFGPHDSLFTIVDALAPFKIPMRHSTGVYWGQCMQRMFEDCIEQNLDWVITVDYDSMITSKHLDTLFGWLGCKPEIDAIAALQPRRHGDTPLMTIQGTQETQINGQPIKCDTAHFGLTVIRMSALKKVPKPWFWTKADEENRYGSGRMDDDIWFWHQWRLAGNTVYIAPDVRIGHLENTVAVFDENMEVKRMSPADWNENYKKAKVWRVP